MKIMKQRWTVFNDICSIARECNLSLVIDWPVACTYWKKVEVGNLLSRLDLKPVDIHGCALALVSVSDDSRGKLIKKHWRFRLIVLRLPIPCVTRLAVVTMIMLHAKVVTLSIVSCTLMILLSACLGHLSVQSSSKCNSWCLAITLRISIHVQQLMHCHHIAHTNWWLSQSRIIVQTVFSRQLLCCCYQFCRD